MKRELPQIDIAGTKFTVDLVHQQLVQCDNKRNKITVVEMVFFPFLNHYQFYFDKVSKSVFTGENWKVGFYEYDVERVCIRPLEALDPEGAEKLLQSGQLTWDAGYRQALPTIDIDGTNYYVDPKRSGYREVDNRWNIIPFWEVIHRGGKGFIYYDKTDKNVPLDHIMETFKAPSKLPQNVIIVEVPSKEKLLEVIRDIEFREMEVCKNLNTSSSSRKGEHTSK